SLEQASRQGLERRVRLDRGARRGHEPHAAGAVLARDREQRSAREPERVLPAHGLAAHPDLAWALGIHDEAVPELAAVAKEHAVHGGVLVHPHALELAVAGAGAHRAADRAVRAHRVRDLEVPHPRAVAEQLVGEHPGGAELDQVAGERALERAVLEAAEVDAVAAPGGAEVAPARDLLVEAAAAVAGDAAVHLVLDELAQVLVLEGALAPAVAADAVPAGDGQILKLALAALVADRAVVRVVDHQPLDHALAELHRGLVERGDLHPVLGLGHAGHHQAALAARRHGARAHAARADRAEVLVVAEHRHRDAGLEPGLDQVRAGGDLDLLAVEPDLRHGPPRPSRRTDSRRHSRAPRGSGGSDGTAP